MGAAKLIKDALYARGMTAEKLAKELGYTSANLSKKMKRDDFREKELLEIARILECDLNITFTKKENGENIKIR